MEKYHSNGKLHTSIRYKDLSAWIHSQAHIHRLTAIVLLAQYIECMQHNNTSCNCVCGGNRWNYITGHGWNDDKEITCKWMILESGNFRKAHHEQHTFDLEPALLLNVKDLRTNISTSGHKVHGSLIVFVPDQMIVDRQLWEFLL